MVPCSQCLTVPSSNAARWWRAVTTRVHPAAPIANSLGPLARYAEVEMATAVESPRPQGAENDHLMTHP